MKRNKIAEITAKFLFDYKMLDGDINEAEVIEVINSYLDDVVFVETLINLIIKRANVRRDIDAVKLIDMLIELERIRLELEYYAA